MAASPDPGVDAAASATTELDQLRAERRIRDILVAYCQGVDRRDWAKVRSCYHQGATDSHGAFAGGPDEFVEWLRRRHEHVLSSMHVLTNVSVQFPGDCRLARAESYCISMQIVEPAAGDPFAGDGDRPVFTTVASRYVDTFENLPAAGWRIRQRQVVFDWMRREGTADFVPLDPSWTLSRRDRDDPLYAPWPDAPRRPDDDR